MPLVASSQVFVADNVLLDGRLALFHEREKWLAEHSAFFRQELARADVGSGG